jgi:hypothetical protein
VEVEIVDSMRDKEHALILVSYTILKVIMSDLTLTTPEASRAELDTAKEDILKDQG